MNRYILLSLFLVCTLASFGQNVHVTVFIGHFTTTGRPSAASNKYAIIYNDDSVLPQAIQVSNGSSWVSNSSGAGGGGSQTLQQVFAQQANKAILTGGDTVVNTGQVLQFQPGWNGSTGVIKYSGLSNDTTSTFGPLIRANDSSLRAVSWQNAANKILPFLPGDTLNGRNGITVTANANGSNDTVWFGGTPLIQATTLAFGANNLTYSGTGTFIISTPLQITAGAGDRKVHISDASGNATWFNFMPFSQTANGTALTNSTVTTDLAGTGVGSTSIAANTFHVGDVVVTHMTTILSTAASAPGTLTIGSTLGGTSIAFTPPSGLTLIIMDITIRTTILTTGTTGTFANEVLAAIAESTVIHANVTTSATINTTIANTLSVQATWGTASASNSIQSTPATNIRIN